MIKNAKVVNHNVPTEVYLRQTAQRGEKDFAMTRSDLKEFYRCPARWKAGFRMDDTESTEWGDIMDCLILTPDQFQNRFAVSPKFYMAEGKKKYDPEVEKPWNRNATYCKEWEAEQRKQGREPIKYDEYEESGLAVGVFRGHPVAGEFLANSKAQVMVVGEFVSSDGIVPIKTLIDIVPGAKYAHCLGDFKTARDAHQDSWSRTVFDYWYHVQAALCLDLYNAATGENRNSFRHLIQENVKPWMPAVRELSHEWIVAGRRAYEFGFNFYSECLAKNQWPDYDQHGFVVDGWPICEPQPWMIEKMI